MFGMKERSLAVEGPWIRLAGTHRRQVAVACGLAAVLSLSVAAASARGRQSATVPPPAPPAVPAPADPPPIDWFFEAASHDERTARSALERLAGRWDDRYTSMIVDLARQMRPLARDAGAGDTPDAAGMDDEAGAGSPPAAPPSFGGPARRPTPEGLARQRLIRFLERQTGQRFGDDLGAWRRWMWRLPANAHPDHLAFKARVYARIDPRMALFFRPGSRTAIRLDEIDWGGVVPNGIPPLRRLEILKAADARYLRDGHVVFGIVVDGEARAYPRRILAWHELALDRLGGVDLAIVYCTLCGTVIPWERTVAGQTFTFGTSGLLYQSNKLMFDEETASLWSSMEGVPVVGPLVGKGLRLAPRPVVTTTWGEWRREHPETTVIGLDTGFERDYSEGAAYRDYLATDRLMFAVSRSDARLKNKDEVLALRVPGAGGRDQPVAVSVKRLRREPVLHLDVAGRRFVVITSPAGANRVFECGTERFVAVERDGDVRDAAGRTWQVTEAALVSRDDTARRLARVAAHRAFWFGWYAQFPDTILVQ
jgi:hypothetical protein